MCSVPCEIHCCDARRIDQAVDDHALRLDVLGDAPERVIRRDIAGKGRLRKGRDIARDTDDFAAGLAAVGTNRGPRSPARARDYDHARDWRANSAASAPADRNMLRERDIALSDVQSKTHPCSPA